MSRSNHQEVLMTEIHFTRPLYWGEVGGGLVETTVPEVISFIYQNIFTPVSVVKSGNVW